MNPVLTAITRYKKKPPYTRGRISKNKVNLDSRPNPRTQRKAIILRIINITCIARYGIYIYQPSSSDDFAIQKICMTFNTMRIFEIHFLILFSLFNLLLQQYYNIRDSLWIHFLCSTLKTHLS